MSDVQVPLALIPLLPLFAAVIIGFLGPRLLRRHSHWPCILAIALSFVMAAIVFTKVREAAHVSGSGEQASPSVQYGTWFEVGEPGKPYFLRVPWSLRADPLSSMMACMVTFVGTLIATFAAGYMDGDRGYARFFAAVSLFVFAMTTLVLADNFLLLFLGWEGVGLCSYLLVGHWFTKPSAADAARKAFLVTRLGDVGMFIGIMLIWFSYGFQLDYDWVFKQVQDLHETHRLDHGILLAACLLLFCGAVGKSAQFPLHVWLPDAMEGPTPVSALIHAATMVTAGVYLVARCTPMFVLVPEAQLTVGIIGGITALLAALIALTQTDLKRVLAYSTLSQLGYMFMALGSGVESLTTVAVIAALFHLFTHAFFKALLFLSAGSVMHAMGNVIDMRRFSGLKAVMPRTHVGFLCGAIALSGFPFASGFWSKDEILASALAASKASPQFGPWYMLLLVVGLATAALTAFYTSRAYFMTFWGPLKVPPEAGSHGHDAQAAHDAVAANHDDHRHAAAHAPPHGATAGVAHESPPLMTVPLLILSVFALGVGFVLGPTKLFEGFLRTTTGFPLAEAEIGSLALMVLSSLLALGGIGVAYVMYVTQPALPAELAHRFQAFYQMSLNKFYFDELYLAFFVWPLELLSRMCRDFDQYFVDYLVDLVGLLPRGIGSLFRPIQNGLVQFYALAMVLGVTVFVIAFVRSM